MGKTRSFGNFSYFGQTILLRSFYFSEIDCAPFLDSAIRRLPVFWKVHVNSKTSMILFFLNPLVRFSRVEERDDSKMTYSIQICLKKKIKQADFVVFPFFLWSWTCFSRERNIFSERNCPSRLAPARGGDFPSATPGLLADHVDGEVFTVEKNLVESLVSLMEHGWLSIDNARNLSKLHSWN